jgi:hypothetical protein
LDSDTLAQMLWMACGSAIDNAAAVNVQSILNLSKVRETRQELERKYAGIIATARQSLNIQKAVRQWGFPDWI